MDSFLDRGMLEETMTEEEIRGMLEQECIKVMVHGQTTEMVNIKKLEEQFKQDYGTERVTIPNNDILQHQWKAGFPLHVTSEDVLEEMGQLFREIHKPWEDKLQLEEFKLSADLKALEEGNKTAQQTVKLIMDTFEDKVIMDMPKEALSRKMQREIEEALTDADTEIQKTRILIIFHHMLHDGVERQLLTKNKAAKAKWGALNNRRGQLGENRTAAAVNQALENYQGMSVSGMKTHTYLFDFLEKVNIQLTFHNQRNPNTGRTVTTNEVEQDNVSTYMEQDTLVVNMIESKTTEFKPWAPPLSHMRRSQAAVKHVKDGLLQLIKSFKTFKEMFPDLLEGDMKKIRYIINYMKYCNTLSPGSSTLFPCLIPAARTGCHRTPWSIFSSKVIPSGTSNYSDARKIAKLLLYSRGLRRHQPFACKAEDAVLSP